MKASIVLLWLLVVLGFSAAFYLYQKVERLESRLAQCESRDERLQANVTDLDSNMRRLGGAHDELVKYLNKQAEAEQQRADAEMGLGLLGLLFGL